MTTLRTHAAAVALVCLVAAVATATGGCAPVAQPTFPPIGSTPQPVGDATAATRAAVIAALAARSLQADDAIRTYRPPEGPLLAAAPRSVLQVRLTDDPDHGYIVIYSLGSPAAALAAARDHQQYLATGTGGQSLLPPGTQVVLRVIGSDVLFFHWLPASSPDPRTKEIAEVLGALGTGV